MNKKRILYNILIGFMLLIGLATAANIDITGNYYISVEESLTANKVVDDKYVNDLLKNDLEISAMNNAARAFSNEVQRCGTADDLTRLNACTAALKTVNDGFE